MVLDTEVKRRINNCRDILVGKVPDPKAQIEQITIALIYKFMDDMDKDYGGNFYFKDDLKEYTWRKLMDTKLTGEELFKKYTDAIELFQNAEHFPEFFRSIFKNTYVPYRDARTLSLFLKEIDFFSYEHSEQLGDAFEYLLSIMGSQGDAGQFRTPRHIIDFIVEIMDPKIGEKILDPACGTAGFLISAYNFMRNKKKDKRLSPIELKNVRDNLIGFDISPDMVRMSKVNMFLHGFENPEIVEFDTLSNDKDIKKWEAKYDLILANPPFMTPKGGIKPHDLFSVTSNRAEVLFVDYISSHLKNETGRAGIIVPEGIIFQSGSAYKELRKKLIERGLYAVISLPAGVFNPYSGVKTSILLLDKSISKKTDDILFLKIYNDGLDLGAQRKEIKDNDLPLALQVFNKYKDSVLTNQNYEIEGLAEKIAHIVPKNKIREEDYNLSGDRYNETVVYEGRWPLVKLVEVCEISSGNSAPQGDKYFIDGEYPFYRTSDVGNVHISLNLNESKDCVNDLAISEMKLNLFPKNTILFPKSGASTFLNHRVMISKEGYVSSHLATINAKEAVLNPRFLFYMLCQIDAKSLTPDQAYPSLKLSDISKIQIPLPPLEVQKRIVEEIENYQNIIDGAKKVIRSYKPSFKIDSEWEMKDFEKLVETITPPFKFQKSDFKESGKYPIIDQSQNEIAGWTDEEKSLVRLNKPAVIFGDHTCVVKFIDKDFAQGADGIKILNTSDSLLPKFLYYYLFVNPIVPDGYNRHFSKLKLIQIPLPPIETQKEIVAQIEEEQKLVNSNKQLIEIFERKIADKIAEVWGE